MTHSSTSFVAIDFETANHNRNSACEIGLVSVREGLIVAEHRFLIRPPTDEFIPWFTDLHGIAWDDVALDWLLETHIAASVDFHDRGMTRDLGRGRGPE